MKIKTVKVGYLLTNCYILEKDNRTLIIDPGAEFQKIKKEITKKISGILLTHHHDDHIGALSQFKDEPIYDYKNLKEGINKIDNFTFNVINTPGHTDESISFLFDDVLFSGDFIFKNSIGRTDLGGNNEDMKNSIKKILKYKDIEIYPGHGEKTTLNNERENLKFYMKNL